MGSDGPRAEGEHRLPAHERIAATLRAEIDGGIYPAGSRLPAELTLSARFRVSRGTLRQAIRNLREEGLVEAVAGRGTFVARGTPRHRDTRRRVVGVVVPSVAQPFVPELLAWIEDELHQRGYSMIVGSSGWTRQQQAGRIHRIVEEGASGLIAYPIDYDPDPPLFEHLVRQDFPIVLIDRYLVGLAIDAVQADNVGGAFMGVAHLVQLGHRRIGFVSTDNLSTTSVSERLQGYEQALRSHGIEPDRSLVLTSLPIQRRWSSQATLETEPNVIEIMRFLEQQRPDAVFTLQDNLAADTVAAAQRLRLRLPNDLPIVSFDDDPPAHRLPVRLTIVAQPREALGRTAARLVVERIEGRRSETARIVLPTELVVRESSGLPAHLPAAAS